MNSKFKLVFAGYLILGVACSLSAQERPRVLGVSHIALKVSDVEKARAFYRDFLGFAEQGQLTNKDGSLLLVFLKVNEEQFFELFTGRQPGEDRLYQVAFQVENIEGLRARLAAQGVKVPDQVPKGRIGNSNFTVKDPNGHTLEFVQYEPDGWTKRDQGKFLSPARLSEHIRHAGFLVSNVPASMEFYGDILGMKETWRGSANGRVLSWINLKVPDGTDYVEFMLCGALMPPPDSRGTANHVCLEVPDMAKAGAALEASPYRQRYTRPIEIKTGKNRKRQLNLYDPDGTRIELMEPHTVDGASVAPSETPLPE